jgi:hypothetical protein
MNARFCLNTYVVIYFNFPPVFPRSFNFRFRNLAITATSVFMDVLIQSADGYRSLIRTSASAERWKHYDALTRYHVINTVFTSHLSVDVTVDWCIVNAIFRLFSHNELSLWQSLCCFLCGQSSQQKLTSCGLMNPLFFLQKYKLRWFMTHETPTVRSINKPLNISCGTEAETPISVGSQTCWQ